MTDTEELELGRQLVESDADPLDQIKQLAMACYLKHQREIVARHGCCGKQNQVWISPMGVACCKHTRDPCPRWKLALLLRLYSQLNRGENGNERTRSRRAERRNHSRGK